MCWKGCCWRCVGVLAESRVKSEGCLMLTAAPSAPFIRSPLVGTVAKHGRVEEVGKSGQLGAK